MRRGGFGLRVVVTTATALALVAGLGAGRQSPPTAAQTGTQGMPASPRRGPDTAPVTIAFYADFADPECGAAAVVLRALLDGDPERVALVFKHRPAPNRPERVLAHYAAVAAGSQGRFWEMADLLFANQKTQRPADLAAMAAQIGLDGERFVSDVNSAAFQTRVAQDLKDAAALKVAVVPTFVINGTLAAGRRTLDELKSLVAEALAAPQPRR